MCAVSTLNQNTNVTQSNYHHGNLREELIQQGLLILEQSQSTDFSMRELTRMIGVSANSVYRHFSNKDELLTALAIYGFQKLLTEQAHQVLNQTNIQDGFLKAGKQYVQFAIKHPTLFKLMYSRFAHQHNNDELKKLSKLAYDGLRYASSNALKIDPESPTARKLAVTAWSTVHGLSHLLIDGQFDDLTDNEKNEMIDQVLSTAYGLA